MLFSKPFVSDMATVLIAEDATERQNSLDSKMLSLTVPARLMIFPFIY